MLLAIGIILIIIAYAIRFWRNKRKFNRRSYGVELFDSYEQSLWVKTLENIASFIAGILKVVGILMILAYLYWKHYGHWF